MWQKITFLVTRIQNSVASFQIHMSSCHIILLHKLKSLEGEWEAQYRTSLWEQFRSAAAGLSVISFLHVSCIVQQLRPNGLIYRQLECHLFKHCTPAASKTLYWIPKEKVYFIEHIHNSTQWDLVTSWKWSFLNMVMLTWFSSPIFAWNFLTPSLVTPDGGKHANHHHKITVFYKCNVKTVLYCLQYLKKGWKNLSFPYRNL